MLLKDTSSNLIAHLQRQASKQINLLRKFIIQVDEKTGVPNMFWLTVRFCISNAMCLKKSFFMSS